MDVSREASVKERVQHFETIGLSYFLSSTPFDQTAAQARLPSVSTDSTAESPTSPACEATVATTEAGDENREDLPAVTTSNRKVEGPRRRALSAVIDRGVFPRDERERRRTFSYMLSSSESESDEGEQAEGLSREQLSTGSVSSEKQNGEAFHEDQLREDTTVPPEKAKAQITASKSADANGSRSSFFERATMTSAFSKMAVSQTALPFASSSAGWGASLRKAGLLSMAMTGPTFERAEEKPKARNSQEIADGRGDKGEEGDASEGLGREHKEMPMTAPFGHCDEDREAQRPEGAELRAVSAEDALWLEPLSPRQTVEDADEIGEADDGERVTAELTMADFAVVAPAESPEDDPFLSRVVAGTSDRGEPKRGGIATVGCGNRKETSASDDHQGTVVYPRYPDSPAFADDRPQTDFLRRALEIDRERGGEDNSCDRKGSIFSFSPTQPPLEPKEGVFHSESLVSKYYDAAARKKKKHKPFTKDERRGEERENEELPRRDVDQDRLSYSGEMSTPREGAKSADSHDGATVIDRERVAQESVSSWRGAFRETAAPFFDFFNAAAAEDDVEGGCSLSEFSQSEVWGRENARSDADDGAANTFLSSAWRTDAKEAAKREPTTSMEGSVVAYIVDRTKFVNAFYPLVAVFRCFLENNLPPSDNSHREFLREIMEADEGISERSERSERLLEMKKAIMREKMIDKEVQCFDDSDVSASLESSLIQSQSLVEELRQKLDEMCEQEGEALRRTVEEKTLRLELERELDRLRGEAAAREEEQIVADRAILQALETTEAAGKQVDAVCELARKEKASYLAREGALLETQEKERGQWAEERVSLERELQNALELLRGETAVAEELRAALKAAQTEASELYSQLEALDRERPSQSSQITQTDAATADAFSSAVFDGRRKALRKLRRSRAVASPTRSGWERAKWSR